MWNRIVVTDRNRGVYGALVHEHLQKRRILFHEKLGWDIPRTEHIEQDQYDRGETVYVLVERAGRVEAYARLMPTTAKVSYGAVEYSYMIRDATRGMLPGIPDDILGARVPPQAASIWEASRVEASGRAALVALFLTIAEYLEEVGADELISFTRKNFDAIVRAIGFDAAVIGEPVYYEGKPYCAISMRWAEALETGGREAHVAAPDLAKEPMRLAG